MNNLFSDDRRPSLICIQDTPLFIKSSQISKTGSFTLSFNFNKENMRFFNLLFDMRRVLMMYFISMIMFSLMATTALADTQDYRFGISSLNGSLASPIIINPQQPFRATTYIITAEAIYYVETILLNNRPEILVTLYRPDGQRRRVFITSFT